MLVILNSSQYQQQLSRAGYSSSSARMLTSSSSTADVKSSVTNSSQTNQRSGGYLPTIYLGLADIYGTIVGTASQDKLTITVNALSNASDVATYPPIVQNINSFYSEAGVYDVYNVQFTAAPGYSYQFLISSNGIDSTKPVNQQLMQTQGTT